MQTCIVHQIRNSMRYVAYGDRKRVAADLKPVHRAVNAEAAEQALNAFDDTWGARSSRCPRIWRRAVHTTNSIENLNRQIRKPIKTRGHFPDEQAATKLIYLAIQRSERKWIKAYNWTGALRGLKIHFGDRLPE